MYYYIVLFSLILFLGMLACLRVGNYYGMRRIKMHEGTPSSGTTTVENAVFALFGLLMAFTFSGAITRFDMRRELIVQEANAIETAYLRLDLLPQSAQPAIRESFHHYLESRLAFYRKLHHEESAIAELTNCKELQRRIWDQAVAASRGEPTSTPMLLLGALNQMIDITTARSMALRTHPPLVIFGLLFTLGLSCSLLAGYGLAGMKIHRWVYQLGFAFLISATVYVILDVEYPRQGLIRVDDFDRAIRDLRSVILK